MPNFRKTWPKNILLEKNMAPKMSFGKQVINIIKKCNQKKLFLDFFKQAEKQKSKKTIKKQAHRQKNKH